MASGAPPTAPSGTVGAAELLLALLPFLSSSALSLCRKKVKTFTEESLNSCRLCALPAINPLAIYALRILKKKFSTLNLMNEKK